MNADLDSQISRYIQPAVPDNDFWVDLAGGAGRLRFKLSWSSSAPSIKGGSGVRHRTASIRGSSEAPESPSRFSLKRIKTKEKE